MAMHASFPRPVAIVLGCGDVGSAVALALHQAGLAVVLADEADPSWHRRGMAFTNAWYVGNAELESEGACFCASLKSIPSILARRIVAATTWSWPGVAAALEPEILVDARGRKRRGAEALRGRVPHAVGIGAGFVPGENVDLTIGHPEECLRGSERKPPGYRGLAEGVRDTGDGPAATCSVEAAQHGRFMTERRIGDAVRVGQIVGALVSYRSLRSAPGAHSNGRFAARWPKSCCTPPSDPTGPMRKPLAIARADGPPVCHIAVTRC